MVQLPTDALAAFYTGLMQQIKERLEAVRFELEASYEKRDTFEGIVRAESACVQVRKVAELLALAVVVAHNEIETFRTNRFVDKWNADAIFGALAKLNDDAFPLRFVVDGSTHDGYANAVVEEEGHLTRDGLCAIYRDCSNLLHVGKLKDLISKPKTIDLGEIQRWRAQIMRLLNNHMIFLPDRSKVMHVAMHQAPDGRVFCEMQDIYEYAVEVEGRYRIRRYRTIPSE